MESDDPLVLKKILKLIMDVDDPALRWLTEALQSLRVKNIIDENVGTVVSYLKGTLLLLKNCLDILSSIKLNLNCVYSIIISLRANPSVHIP